MICFRRNLEMAMVMICVQFFDICKQIQWLDCSRCSRYMYESLRTPTPRRNDSQAVWHNEFRAKSLIWRWQGEEYSLRFCALHARPQRVPIRGALPRYSQTHWSCQPLGSCECFSLPRRRQAATRNRGGWRMEAVFQCVPLSNVV